MTDNWSSINFTHATDPLKKWGVGRQQGKQQGPDPVPIKENRKFAISYKMLDCAFGLLAELYLNFLTSLVAKTQSFAAL